MFRCTCSDDSWTTTDKKRVYRLTSSSSTLIKVRMLSKASRVLPRQSVRSRMFGVSFRDGAKTCALRPEPDGVRLDSEVRHLARTSGRISCAAQSVPQCLLRTPTCRDAALCVPDGHRAELAPAPDQVTARLGPESPPSVSRKTRSRARATHTSAIHGH